MVNLLISAACGIGVGCSALHAIQTREWHVLIYTALYGFIGFVNFLS